MSDQNKLNEISRAIGRLEGSVDIGFETITGRLDRMNGTLKSHDKRINKVESEQDKAKGIATILGGIAGTVI
ncbi:hypothetical protein HQ584_08540, partial [Patescibacteria group bacterium]|nr:hypothetical protein [Patescibacteria group bacterium]